MLTLVKRTLRLVRRAGYLRAFLTVVVLAAVVSAFEAVGAGLVLVLMRMVTTPEQAFDVPGLGDLRDRFPGTSEDGIFVGLALVVAVFFVVRAGVYLAQNYVQYRVAYTAGVALSRQLVRGYLEMPYAWHLQRNSSEMIRNANDAIRETIVYVMAPFVTVMSETLVVFAMLVVLFVTAPGATALALAFLGPLVLLLLRVVQPRLVALGERQLGSAEKVLRALQQGLHGVREIKVLGREAYFEGQFFQAQHQYARAQYVRSTLTEAPRVVVEAAVIVLIAVFLMVQRSSVRGDTETLAVLGLFTYALLRLMPAMNRIVAGLNYLKFGSAATTTVERELDRLAGAVRPDSETGGERLELGETIELRRVAFRYEGAASFAIRDVDLTIRAGESIGIVGPTGGGKSTLVDVVLGLLEPTEGVVMIDGVDLRGRAPAWHQSLGVVPQSPFLFDDTLRRNIALGLVDDAIDDERVREAVALAQLEDFVASSPEGLDSPLGERGVRLSGGQRQRVAIARALYRGPDVLMFDEATSALDAGTEALLVQAIERLRGSRTILTVAHRLSTVRNCDRILVLREGRIVDSGKFDELLVRSGEFRELASSGSLPTPPEP